MSLCDYTPGYTFDGKSFTIITSKLRVTLFTDCINISTGNYIIRLTYKDMMSFRELYKGDVYFNMSHETNNLHTYLKYAIKLRYKGEELSFLIELSEMKFYTCLYPFVKIIQDFPK